MNVDRRGFLAAMAPVVAGGAGVMIPGGGTGPGRDGEVSGWRTRFPALDQQVNGRPLAYLDNAATTQRPREVIQALSRFYGHDNANPSPRLHTLARRAAAGYGAARETVARFVNAADAAEIVFTRGTTEAINLVAATWGTTHVKEGDEIVLTVAEHSSNLLPWQRLARQAGAGLRAVDLDDEGRIRMDELERALTPRTRLVAVCHVSNVLGLANPVEEICSLARRSGARVLVDAAQSAPHIRLDVRRLGCDFLVFSSHKMLGPMGVGVLWARRDLLDEMPPYQTGSNMAHEVDFASARLEPAAFRFEAGTPNASGAVGLAAAIRVLEEIGFDTLGRQDRVLTVHALTRLGGIRGLRILGPKTEAGRMPVFSFVLEGASVPAIVDALDAEGIAVRGGDLAALPLLKRFGVTAAARASLYLYNTTGEIDRLVEVLEGLRRGGAAAPGSPPRRESR